MPWWQVLLVLSIIITLFGIFYSMQAARDVESGKEVDRGVGGRASKHKIRANPIFWSYIVFALVITAVAICYIFIYPDGAF